MAPIRAWSGWAQLKPAPTPGFGAVSYHPSFWRSGTPHALASANPSYEVIYRRDPTSGLSRMRRIDSRTTRAFPAFMPETSDWFLVDCSKEAD